MLYEVITLGPGHVLHVDLEPVYGVTGHKHFPPSWHDETVGEQQEPLAVVGSLTDDLLVLAGCIPGSSRLLARKLQHDGDAGRLAFDGFAIVIRDQSFGAVRQQSWHDRNNFV